jgi:hypothetical protein
VDRALELAATIGRNNAGFWLALQLRDAGLALDDARTTMLRYQQRTGATNTKGAPEAYTEAEAEATLQSAYSKSPRGPWPEVDAGAPNSGPNSTHPHPPAGVPWPSPPEKAAFQGLAGDWVRLINPHTEADPVALLVQLLVAFGGAVGRSPYTEAEAVRHYTNMFEALVGETAKGRKGTSYAWIRRLLELADGKWVKECNVSGLSSGEGLIWHVRDPISRTRPIREKNRTVGYEQELEDAGVLDKRLLVHEGELAGALRAMSREGNTLSAVLRAAWDTGDLRSLTKNAPARATGAHISVIGHVTRDEVNKELNQTDRANGFANRFLWIAVRRSKVLPEGGRLDLREFEEFAERFREVLEMARNVSRVERDAGARDLWAEIYQDLSEGRPGLLGAITSRSEAQVTRLSLLYALLAGRREVAVTDLQAALALWGYCERSARYIFGEAVAETDEAKQLRQLVQVIAGRPGRTITVHWLSNSGPRRYRRNRDRAERDLMELEKQGFGVLRDPPSGPATGRVFVLNPGALDADASDSEPNSGHSHPLHPSECDRKAVEDFLGGTL